MTYSYAPEHEETFAESMNPLRHDGDEGEEEESSSSSSNEATTPSPGQSDSEEKEESQEEPLAEAMNPFERHPEKDNNEDDSA